MKLLVLEAEIMGLVCFELALSASCRHLDFKKVFSVYCRCNFAESDDEETSEDLPLSQKRTCVENSGEGARKPSKSD